MLNKQERLRLEQDILGTIITRNCYHQIANIIKEEHFIDWPEHPHRLIFRTIAECQPAIHVDIVVISQILRQNPDLKLKIDFLGIENYIAHITGRVTGEHGLHYLCFVLHEEDVRSKLMKLMVEQGKKLVGSPVDRSNLDSAYKQLEAGADIFEVLEQLPVFLEKVEYPAAMLNDIRAFCDSVSSNIEDIKKLSQLDVIISSLLSLADPQSMAPEICSAVYTLSTGIKHIFYEESVAPEVYKKIDELRQLLG